MFPYFGRKQRNAKVYPVPLYDLIVEPFAGSMAYSLHHKLPAIGHELDGRVYELWYRCLVMGWGGKVPPTPEVGSTTNDLLVKLCSYSEHALTSGAMKVSSRMVRDWESVNQKIIDSSKWAGGNISYRNKSYLDAPDIEATWFIDPPYQHANKRGYLYGADAIDFEHLADWVKTRRGQVIVCEQEGADWLPFRPLYDLQSHRGSRSTEMIWTND